MCFFVYGCSQIIPGEASLLTTLDEMHTLCLKMFYNSLNYHASKLMDKVSFLKYGVLKLMGKMSHPSYIRPALWTKSVSATNCHVYKLKDEIGLSSVG